MSKFQHLLLLLFSISTGWQEAAIFELKLSEVLPEEKLVLYEKCIVIPRSGCAGCISSAMSFVSENIDSLDDTLIIFTGIQDLKLLKLRLGNRVINKKNVIVDTLGKIRENLSYPTFLRLAEGKVKNVERFLVNQYYGQ